MKYISTNHRNPCPLCQDTSGDCRTTETGVILCHDFIHSDSGVAGYIWKKPASNGVWGIHAPDNGKEFDKEQYERHKAQKEAEKRDKKQFLADNALDAEGRDKAIRKLARHAGLSDRSRQDLIRRGLSDRAIEDGLFFDVDPWRTFNLDLPTNLPGISYKGDRFSTKDSGYACPIFDTEGRAIGWQLRVEGVTKGSKYKWAKGSFSSHLPTGELPITLVKPAENAFKTLYLTEGVLKPYITSQTLNLPVCGAAGGYFSGSPQQFEKIAADYGEFVIVPDAGDLVNSSVMQRWKKQIDFLKQFGKPIKVLWWGQASKTEAKSANDIDEIDLVTFSKAEYLLPDKFFKLSEKQQFIKQTWDNWRELKKFTPQIKVCEEFINFGMPQVNTMTFIKSGLGTGKTTKVIERLKELKNHGIINLGYRNTLLLQFNEKAKEIFFYHLQSDKKLEEFNLAIADIKVSNCIDSLVYYQPEYFDGKIIVIDEIVSAIKHLLYSPTIKHFEKVKELFNEMINRCERLICLDGFMQDWAVDFFRGVCPTKEIVTIENTFKGNSSTYTILEGSVDIDEKIRANDKSPILEKLFDSSVPVLGTDSQIFCESATKILKKQGRQGVRIDSKTVGEPKVKEFFTNPEEQINQTEPEYLGYTPSAESGLDIPNKGYFSEQFNLFFGNIDVDSACQLAARTRDTELTRYLYAKKFVASEDTLRRPSNVEAIRANRTRLLLAELQAVIKDTPNLSKEAISSRLQQIHRDAQDPYTKAADTIQAIRNHEFANYRECIRQQLIEAGHNVVSWLPDRSDDAQKINKMNKESKDEVKEQNSKDIHESSDEYIGKEQANLNFDAAWSTRCAVMKASIVNRLPGINNNPVWSLEFIRLVKYDNPNLIASAALYYLLENTEVARQLAQTKYNKIFNRGKIAAPWKLRQSYLKVKALRDIGLYDFIQKAIADPEYKYTAESPEVGDLITKCKQRKNRMVLGAPGKDTIKFLHKLLKGVGILSKSKVTWKEGKSVRHHYIDVDWLNSPEMVAIAEATKLKYERKISALSAPLEWQQNEPELAQNKPIQKLESVRGENPDQERATLPYTLPSIVNKNRAKCKDLNSPDSADNSKPKLNATDIEINPLDSEESINDLASMLMTLENAEGLAEFSSLGGVFSRSRLNRAVMRLSIEWQQRIRGWVAELNSAAAAAAKAKHEEKINSQFTPLEWQGNEPDLAENQAIQKLETVRGENLSQQRATPPYTLPSIFNKNRAKCKDLNSPDLAGNPKPKLDATDVEVNPLDTEESINDLASMLMTLEDAEGLADFSNSGEVFSRSRLNRAVMRLSIEWQQRIRGWFAEWRQTINVADRTT